MKDLKTLIKNHSDISISELAREIKVTRQTIYNVLNDKNIPTIPTIKSICKYFNVDYKDYV